MDGGEEISCGLVIAGGDRAELLEFTEEVLDRMARLVEFSVEIAWRHAVLPGRDDSRFAGGCEWLEDPIVGIEGLIGDQQIGGHLRQQPIGSDQIMCLS